MTHILGTSVSVWGTISNVGNAPISSYCIDGGAEEIYNATLSQIIQYQRPFFQSTPLTLASHTLVITILTEDAFFFLDYILVTPDITASSSTPSTLSPYFYTSSTLAPYLRPHTVSSVTTTRSATTSPVDSSKDKVPLGFIVGGVLGVLALILIAFIGFMFIRKNSKGRSYERKPTFTKNSSCEFRVFLQCIVWVLNNRFKISPVWDRVPRASGGITPLQPHLYHPLPDPGLHYSESVYKRPLLPISTPSIPTLGTAPPSKLSQYNALSQGSLSRGASTSSSGPLASTSTHRVSTSATISSDLPPPRYDG